MSLTPLDLLPVAVSFGGTLALTPLVRSLARRRGMVARPKADRWHKRPTALLGGVSIFLPVAAVELAFVRLSAGALAVGIAAAFLFVVGLIDDVLNLKPYQKLAGQILAAAGVIACGLTLPWTGSPPLNAAITLLWLVGITNAVNLLDNMDGLAAGIAAIASGSLAFHFLAIGQADEVVMLAVFAAALLGFLVYNTNPASIFMGDCGSLFLGFFLAGSALLHPAAGRSRTFLPVLAVPVLTLFIPILDTLFVMVLRKLAGRPVSLGGRDHTSHRLVALGLSERHAVLLLYGLAALSGLLALLVHNLPLDVSLATIVGFTIVLALLGIQLARVQVYGEHEVRFARERPLVAFLVVLSYKRRVLEVFLDVLLIALAFYTAHALVYGPITRPGTWERYLPVIAVLVGVKLLAFLMMGVYRGLWRHIGLDNLVVYAKAVLAGSAASALALLMTTRFEGLSRVVFVLDGLLLLSFVMASRLSFRLFRRLLTSPSTVAGRRVLIYGAGDAGVLLARELFNNPSLGRVPVGFADDDPFKKGSVIHGLTVFGGNGSFLAICRKHAIDEVMISSMRFTPGRIEAIAHDCTALSVPLRRMRIQIEPLDDVPSPMVRSVVTF